MLRSLVGSEMCIRDSPWALALQTQGRLRSGRPCVGNEDGMSWQTADLLSADTTDVLAADTTDVLAADTTDAVAADTTDVLPADTAGGRADGLLLR